MLDVVRKEFKGHVGEMEALRSSARDEHGSAEKWVAFQEKDDSFHLNLFSHKS